jgi:prepilin peptidase CpaA
VILPLDILLLLSVSLAALFDIRERRIPNWITFSGAAIALILHAVTGSAQLLQSVLGLAVGIGAMFVPFVCGWLGAGDVKLLGLMGAIVGLQSLPRVLFYSVVIGGLLAGGALIGRNPVNVLRRSWWDIKIAISTLGFIMPVPITEATVAKTSIPFGVAIGAGTLVALYFDPNGKWAGF